MLSDKQLAANRANAARSTGPRSPEGKLASAQNARKHGFTASAFHVTCLEDAAEIENLRADLIDLYRPINSQELFALERIAVAQHKLLRADRLEAGLFESYMSRGAESSEQSPNLKFADGFEAMAEKPAGFQLFLRYQAQNERLYRRAVEDFDRIRKQRAELAELPNEPILSAEPQPGQPFIHKPNEPTETYQAGYEAAHKPAAQEWRNEPISAADPTPEPEPGIARTASPNEPISAPQPPPHTQRPAARKHRRPRKIGSRLRIYCHNKTRRLGQWPR